MKERWGLSWVGSREVSVHVAAARGHAVLRAGLHAIDICQTGFPVLRSPLNHELQVQVARPVPAAPALALRTGREVRMGMGMGGLSARWAPLQALICTQYAALHMQLSCVAGCSRCSTCIR